VGVAEATTVTGDVTVAPSVGLEMVSGKSSDAAGGGVAGGAGSGLDCGDHVIGTGGVEGLLGGVGVGVGCVGVGVGVGCVGVGVGVGVGFVVVVGVFVVLVPHPERTMITAKKSPSASA
jgi:hypothetical protein